MNRILAIGGRLVKENYKEVKEIARQKKVDAFMLAGSTIFHDFQRSTESLDGKHSIPLEKLIEDYTLDRNASMLVWDYIYTALCPEGSLVDICQLNDIPVLLFSDLGADFWHLFPYVSGEYDWQKIASRSYNDFYHLVYLMSTPFEFYCMGSDCHLPEIFIKALSVSKQKDYTSISVDPEGCSYRLRTRFKEHVICSFDEYLRRMLNA